MSEPADQAVPRTRCARLQRAALAAAILASAGFLAGCPPQPPPLATRPAITTAQETLPDAPIIGAQPTSGGVYEAVPPRPADASAMEQARLDRAAILERVTAKAAPASTRPATQPAALAAATQPAVAAAGEERPAESTSPLAVKYYLRGRERFLQGANSEAMDQLEKALQLDPQAFTVLRLMGRVCFAASQLVRGSRYLEDAHRLRPQDVETNYLLGRYWLERKDYDRAVYYLMSAEDSPERQPTSTQMPLSAFYLARALQNGGYHLAAAKEFERFLALTELPLSGYRYDREMSYLIDERWASELAAAENFSRVDEYAGALPHYEAAARLQPRDLFIASRLIHALVRAGKQDAARDRALALVASTNGSSECIRLMAWTYRASGRENSLVEDLRARIAGAGSSSGGDDASLALTLAMTQEYMGKKAEAFATLRGYLAEHPVNMDILGRLLKRVDSPEMFRAGLECAAAAIAADRTLNGEVIKLFVPITDSAAAVAWMRSDGANGIGQPSTGSTFAAAYLAALTARVQNAPPEVIERRFQQSLQAAPDFAPARDAFVAWLLDQEKFPRANEIVQAAVSANPSDPGAWTLLVRSEAAQQRYLSALKLAQDARQKFPDNNPIRMELVNVYRLRGQDDLAEAELTAMVNAQPKNEDAYRALINSMMQRIFRRGGGGNAAAGPIITVLARMNRELPDSHYAQLQSAMFFARGGRLEEAEGMLRKLQALTPEDPDVLIPLAQIRQALGHTADAMATLNSGMKTRPQPELVRALATLYRDDDKPAEALSFTRRVMEENPDVESFIILHATELTVQDKTADAIELLRAASKRLPRSEGMAVALARMLGEAGDFPAAAQSMQTFIRANGETTDLLYTLSHFYSAAGNEEATTAALQRILAIMPDHIGANNDLGYFWADAGIKIPQAEGMIRKAIENEPNNSAFVDSLGWLYYKQGRFADAVTQLSRALTLPGGAEPEVIRHLGDALFRAGRTNEAVERWRQAFDMLNAVETAAGSGGGRPGSGLSPIARKNREYLEKVIKAASGGGQPELTPIAEASGLPVDPALPSATQPSGGAGVAGDPTRTPPATGPQ